MKIEQLLQQPHGQKIGGFDLNIKTYKKTWEADGFHWQQVICMDSTGEMPVDVNLGKKYNPLRGRTRIVHVTVADIQPAEYLSKDRNKLVVHEFTFPTSGTVDDYLNEVDAAYQVEMKEVRGKIRHGLCCAYVQGYARNTGTIPETSENRKNDILEWVEFIMTGE